MPKNGKRFNHSLKNNCCHCNYKFTLSPSSPLCAFLLTPCCPWFRKKPQVTNRFGKDKLHAGSSCQISSKSRSKVVEQQPAAEAESMVPQLWVVHNFVEGRPAGIIKTLSAVETVGCLKSSFSIPAVSLITIEATEKRYTQARWERKQSSMTQDMTLAKKLEGRRCQFVWTIKVERESMPKRQQHNAKDLQSPDRSYCRQAG